MTVITVWPGATAQECRIRVAELLENGCRNSGGMTAPKPIPARAWRLSPSPYRDMTPLSEVQEEFLSGAKSLGDESKISRQV